MDEPIILRTTKIGNGYVKEDVMQYLDELNTKIEKLEKELADAQQTGPSDPEEIIKYRNQVDRLQEKLNQSNNTLRTLRDENEALKKQIANGGGQTGSTQAEIELKNAKAEIERLKSQIEVAKKRLEESGKGGAVEAIANPQAEAELKEAKAEIEKLKGQLEVAKKRIDEANAKVTEAQKSAQADSKPAISNEIAEKLANEIKSKDQDIKKLESQIEEMKKIVVAKEAEATKAKSEKESEISKLKAENEKEINKIIEEKNKEIENAKASATPGTMFDNIIKMANEQAEVIKEDARKSIESDKLEAEKVLQNAKDEAKKIIDDATVNADICIKEANYQANTAIRRANKEADRINAMTDTVRNMLRNEINGVSSKFEGLLGSIEKITSNAKNRLMEADIIIEEARKTISDEKIETAKEVSTPAPKATASSEPAPKNDTNSFAKKEEKKPANFSFDMADLVKAAEQEAEKNPEPVEESAPAPAPAKQLSPQEKQAKKVNNFNFDMADLVKAAEADLMGGGV